MTISKKSCFLLFKAEYHGLEPKSPPSPHSPYTTYYTSIDTWTHNTIIFHNILTKTHTKTLITHTNHTHSAKPIPPVTSPTSICHRSIATPTPQTLISQNSFPNNTTSPHSETPNTTSNPIQPPCFMLATSQTSTTYTTHKHQSKPQPTAIHFQTPIPQHSNFASFHLPTITSESTDSCAVLHPPLPSLQLTTWDSIP